MTVVVNELDNTNTTYNFAPSQNLLVELEKFYRHLSERGAIKGFAISGDNGLVVSHKSI
jgi:hypothetical protein